jgi:hypothetical protein
VTPETQAPVRTSGPIEVRIRTDEHTSTESVYLCSAPIEELDGLIRDVCKWGVYVDNNDHDPFMHATGQFAITDQAFFEIVLRGADDA